VSDRGLVVRQQALTDIETAMSTATADLGELLTTMLDRVDQQTSHWTEETPSRQAQRDHERRLREGIERLTEALERVRAEVASYRDEARSTEVDNVAVVG
jgi:50S ribosomal subunit-associated GTPase HflX